ncbi:MAG: pilus (MSHA type) biogenesis protein MshL [Pseudomonadota bacterium]
MAGHITAETQPDRAGAIPAPVTQTFPVPVPRAAPKQETFSVSVVNVPVQDLLFALARDAKLNIDVHPGIGGVVTLNAIDQTLPQILSRISKQADMRYEVNGGNLIVMPDTPFLRSYKVDYVNMSRDTNATVAIATQVATTGQGAGTGAAAPAGGNNSTTNLTNVAKNRFWETLVANIKDLLRETDKILPEGSYETVVQQDQSQATSGTGAPQPTANRRTREQGVAGSPNPAVLQSAGSTTVRRATYREAASVIANPETGVLTVRATARQHEKVQEFLDQVMTNARRQVMIEATVLEVNLSDNYQQGIDWGLILKNGRWNLSQTTAGLPSAITNTLFTGTYTGGDFKATIKLMESFGTVKVLSSPKISVINNQTALLKVVDNRVYFTIEAQQTQAVNAGTLATFTTTVNTVPVGFVMSVTPQISETDTVLLNVRPSISRVTGFVNDPNPLLAAANVVSQIPEIQTREMESVLRVNSGDTAVMGGLMQDGVENRDDGIPGVSRVPLVGEFFTQRNDTRTKSELVIFLRPVVIRNASLDGDYASYRSLLPDQKFLEEPKFDNFFGAGRSTIPLPSQ